MDEFYPIRFIEEPIMVYYDKEPVLEKKPECPQGFRWRDQDFSIIRLVSEWRDYQRRGRMARNMQPQHAAVASTRGSWGVGKFYFRVEVLGDRFFDIYYDRAPKNVDNRKGLWSIFQELTRRDM